jgi:outer membrane protein OmpA-like peptidoglycan-associated protein
VACPDVPVRALPGDGIKSNAGVGGCREALAAAWRAEEAQMLERAQRVHEATIEDIQAELSGALTEVGFAKNAATILEPDGRAAIQQIAHVLRKYDFVYVCVEGHAQRQEAKPRKLSEDRAQVVTKELTVAVRLVLCCLVLAWLVLSCLSVG